LPNGWRERYSFYLAIAGKSDVAGLTASPLVENGLDKISAAENSDDELLRLLRIDWQTQLAENLLLLADKMSMVYSLECRVPFLDHKMVELAASIPARHKLPNGRLKGLSKDSLRGVLPSSIIDRRKRGFGAPVGAWFKQELAGLRSELLHPTVLERRGFVDPDSVQRMCAAHYRNREDYTDLILVLMKLEIWARLFLGGRSHEDVFAQLAERSLAA
jgi:asparagine synthase (glutamine-hydrolysing)